jgi:putative transposase
MTLSNSDLSDLLDALRVGEGIDLIREIARWVLQELIETEAAEQIGAGRYQRVDERLNERNGHRPKTLSTKAGDLQVGIAKLRNGSFFPSILEPRRRIDTGISKSEVSRICGGLDERVGAFRNRTLGHTNFPYVYLDATYVNVRDDALGPSRLQSCRGRDGDHRTRQP